MRRPRLAPAFLLPAVASVLVGCGGASAPASPSPVQLSITAPTDGSVVAVRHIYVIGTIQPSDATVRVSGTRVRVKEGAFKQSLVLERRVTHIKIIVSAKGHAGSTTWVTVHYAPSRNTLVTSSGGSSQGPSLVGSTNGGAIYPAKEAGFMAGCTNSNPARVDACQCLWKQLVREGFDTEAQWRRVVADWRRTFLAKGTISYPAPIKHAIIACASRFRG